MANRPMLELEERHVVVYRIQSPGGHGPYSYEAYEHLKWSRKPPLPTLIDWSKGFEFDECGDMVRKEARSFSGPDHPCPSDDGIFGGDWHSWWIFGHASVEQMVEWWGDALDLLSAFGLEVATFRVPARFVVFGGKQAIFDPRHAVRL